VRPSPGKSALRILTAVPICDGHDSAINTINMELVRAGVEVVYLGYHRSSRDIVRAAIQEDVAAIGISSYNGGHVEFFAEVRGLLEKQDAGDIGLFGGGGGTITAADAGAMTRGGVDRIFFAGTPLDEIVSFVLAYGERRPAGRVAADRGGFSSDRRIARLLTAVELPPGGRTGRGAAARRRRPRTVGIAGPGGAGKTTLIDEIVRRVLVARPHSRVAILSHDPSIVGKGALLGDRATMIASQDDRVFMRSLATHGTAGGVADETGRCLEILTALPFDLVLVETVGIGQESLPFAPGMVDLSVLVMSPEYGARLQLQKIVMLDAADVVVVNKGDMAAAKTAVSEIDHRLRMNGRDQRIIATVAKAHRDPGVDELLLAVLGEAVPAGAGAEGQGATSRGAAG
jgi:methylmalonyl-CoA mutase cobalamin-binding domain/chain